MDAKEELILGDAVRDHWYYVSKGRALLDILGKTAVEEVVDVGAGSGVFSKLLLEKGLARSAICVDPAYERERTIDHQGHPLRFVHSIPQQRAELILMMDVLEHVPDDLGLVKEYSQYLDHSGRMLITVPAFQSLWSSHDVFLEHYRRYTLPTLTGLLRRAGLQPIASRYFFGFILPIAAAVRVRERLKLRSGSGEARSSLRAYPPALNRALAVAHELERRLLFPWNKIGGLTVFCLARRAEER